MRVTDSAIFGLVSLVCTVNATKAIGKPVHAKRQAVATVTSNGCVAVCEGSLSNNKGVDCEVYCTGISSTATSTSTSTTTSTVISTVTSKARAALNRRTVVSASNGACHETCSINEAEGDFDCGWSCDADFSTLMPATSTTKAPLHQRTVVSAVDGDCTAICWDLMPGTECDVQCSSDSKTEMPAPSRAARIANLEARQNVQAYQVHEARLARKFGGLGARDDSMTVTVTSIPENCTAGPELSISTTIGGIPTILPMQVPQPAGASVESAILSQASAAMSAVQQVLPTFASEASAASKVESLLSSMLAPAFTSSTATSAAPVTTSSAPKVSATTTATSTASETTTASATASKTTTASATASKTTTASATASKTTTASATASKTTTASVTSSKTSTASTTSSETITESTTTTGSLVVSEAATTISSSFPTTGAASEHTVSTGLVLCLLVGLAAKVVFLI